jgi:heme exporter protein D
VNWGSWDNFWAMGGYAFYVWGSYAMAAAVIAIEIWRLKARRRQAIEDARRGAARSERTG